jgi:hypothetical protein
MSQHLSTSFLDLFNAALQEYENQTGTNLVEHPLAKQFETCDSVDSIIAVLQEQAQVFREFRDNGKLMKSLKSSVDVLYPLSTSTVFSEGVGLVHSKSLLRFFVSNRHYIGIPTFKGNIRWHRHPTRRMSPSPIPSAYLVIFKPRRRSKISALAMTHSSICLHPSKPFSADLAFIQASLPRRR